jgi:anti-sigma B factor antagonist
VEEFTVKCHARDGRTLLAARGELDLAASPVLQAQLDSVTDDSGVVVDLRGVSFMDSAGLGVLVRTDLRSRREGRRFSLLIRDGQVKRLLRLSGLLDELTVVESLDELPPH